METKEAFKVIGISRDEAESMSQSLSQCRQVGCLSVLHHLLSDLAPSAVSMLCPLVGFCRAHVVHYHPPSGETPKIQAHLLNLHSFVPIFSHLWNQLPPSVQFLSFLQSLNMAVHHHLSSFPIHTYDFFLILSNLPQVHPFLSRLLFPTSPSLSFSFCCISV